MKLIPVRGRKLKRENLFTIVKLLYLQRLCLFACKRLKVDNSLKLWYNTYRR